MKLATADGSPNNSVYLWNVATGRMTGELTDPDSQGIGYLAYIQDGKTLAASDGNGIIYLWDIATDRIIATLTAPSPHQ
jgi:WD40 repeat protein